MLTKEIYLVITGQTPSWNKGYVHAISVESRASKPKLNSNQIAVKTVINVPEAYFQRLAPVVEIKLPEDAVVGMDVSAAIQITGMEVADKLKIDAQEVIDGLTEIYKKKFESLKEENV